MTNFEIWKLQHEPTLQDAVTYYDKLTRTCGCGCCPVLDECNKRFESFQICMNKFEKWLEKENGITCKPKIKITPLDDGFIHGHRAKIMPLDDMIPILDKTVIEEVLAPFVKEDTNV